MARRLLGLWLGFYIIFGLGSVQAQVGARECRVSEQRIKGKRQETRLCKFGSDPRWYVVKIRLFYPSGRLNSEENFLPGQGGQGIFHGLQTYWNESGRKSSEASFDRGRVQWLKRWYTTNGQLTYYAQFQNGLFKNPFVIYDPNGNVELEVHFDGDFCSGSFTAKNSKLGIINGRMDKEGNLLKIDRKDPKGLEAMLLYCRGARFMFFK